MPVKKKPKARRKAKMRKAKTPGGKGHCPNRRGSGRGPKTAPPAPRAEPRPAAGHRPRARKSARRERRGVDHVSGLAIGSLRVERVLVSEIKPAAYNPRKRLGPKDPEYGKLKRSIEEFGYVDPLVWNRRSGNLVGGHQRFTILVKEHKVTEVDVSVVDLAPAAERALNLGLNRITGEWDDAALAALLLELQADETVEQELTGFTDDDIATLAAQVELSGGNGELEPTVPAHSRLSHSFRVVANCVNAKQQTQVEKMLRGKGIAFHTLTRD